jgi:hypothetical protein
VAGLERAVHAGDQVRENLDTGSVEEDEALGECLLELSAYCIGWIL